MPYPDSNKTAIYVLVDPVTDAVRYVGRASRPDSRLYYHIYSSCRAQEDRCDSRMLWIKGLVASGLAPIMRIVSETDAESASALESQTALQYLREGADLTNDLSVFGLVPKVLHPEAVESLRRGVHKRMAHGHVHWRKAAIPPVGWVWATNDKGRRVMRPDPGDIDADYDTARDLADDAIREQAIPDDPGGEHQPF